MHIIKHLLTSNLLVLSRFGWMLTPDKITLSKYALQSDLLAINILVRLNWHFLREEKGKFLGINLINICVTLHKVTTRINTEGLLMIKTSQLVSLLLFGFASTNTETAMLSTFIWQYTDLPFHCCTGHIVLQVQLQLFLLQKWDRLLVTL